MVKISKERFKEIQKSQYPLEKNIMPVTWNGKTYSAGSIYCGFKGTVDGKFTDCALVYEHIYFEIEGRQE